MTRSMILEVTLVKGYLLEAKYDLRITRRCTTEDNSADLHVYIVTPFTPTYI